jgi:hypothetical protein
MLTLARRDAVAEQSERSRRAGELKKWHQAINRFGSDTPIKDILTTIRGLIRFGLNEEERERFTGQLSRTGYPRAAIAAAWTDIEGRMEDEH